MLTFHKQWIFLYYLHAPPPSLTGFSSDSTPTLQPIAQYKWRWRIDSISVAPRRSTSHPSFTMSSRDGGALPTIDLLIRFDTYYPWPVNILHHFVLPPNPEYIPDGASFSP